MLTGTCNEYSALQGGVVSDISDVIHTVGVSIAVPNKQSKLEGAYLLMGSATFTQSVYRAFTRSPDNPKVRPRSVQGTLA